MDTTLVMCLSYMLTGIHNNNNKCIIITVLILFEEGVHEVSIIFYSSAVYDLSNGTSAD